MGDTENGTWSSRELGAYIRKEYAQQEALADLEQMKHADELARLLAAYFLFVYTKPLQTADIRANDVTTPETEGGYDQTENSSPGAKRKN